MIVWGQAEMKASVLTLQHHLDEVTAERESLKAQLEELKAVQATEEAEWRQFQVLSLPSLSQHSIVISIKP